MTLWPERITAKLVPEKEGAEPRSVSVVRVEDPELMRELLAHHVRVVGAVPGNPWLHLGLWLLPLGLVFLLMRVQSSGAGAGS